MLQGGRGRVALFTILGKLQHSSWANDYGEIIESFQYIV